MNPPEEHYSREHYMLAEIINTLRTIPWQFGGDPNAPRPQLLLLPGMVDPSAAKQLGDSMTIEEMDARLERYRPM